MIHFCIFIRLMAERGKFFTSDFLFANLWIASAFSISRLSSASRAISVYDFCRILLRKLENEIPDSSWSADLEAGSDFKEGDARCSVRVFERYIPDTNDTLKI